MAEGKNETEEKDMNNPCEIDEQLAKLWTRAGKIQESLKSAASFLHSMIGERGRYVTRTRVEWPTTDAEAQERAVAGLAAVKAYYAENGTYIGAPGPVASYNISNTEKTLAQQEKLHAELPFVWDQADELEAVYDAQPWSRFFLVTSSAGHVHSSMHCHTCKQTTTYGWLPQLSGKSEAEAVEQLGTVLCSVCFPTAPVAHTDGKITKAKAAKLAA